jgi:perosamine synthetase
VNEPALGERDLEYVTECIRSGWISSAGSFIDRFEAGWAAYCGRRYGVSVANGSVALQAAVAALELAPGDEILMPAFTIISCATAALYNGAVPALVDADPETWCLDVGALEAGIGPRTRAIMPVHIYGHPVEMEPLLKLAARHGLPIIEDAAEAHGAECLVGGRWQRCGGFGELSCFSFYANKLVTTGEGGMVVTDDPDLAERLKSIRNLGFGAPRRFLHERLGHNFRLTNLQAALGTAQIERMDAIVQRKREIGRYYNDGLQGLDGLQLPVERPWARSVYWMYGVVLVDDLDLDAEELAARLRNLGVETRPFFLGLHEQPALRERGLFARDSFPVTERIARRGLYLPSGLGLTETQLADVVAAVGTALS